MVAHFYADGLKFELARLGESGTSLEERLCALRTYYAGLLAHSADNPIDGGPGSSWPHNLNKSFKHLCDDPNPAIRECLAECLALSSARIENPEVDALDYRFVGDVLAKLAADPDAGVRRAVASKIRRNTSRLLTISRKLAPTDFRPEMAVLILASAPHEDKTLAFAIWNALEPYIAAHPRIMLPWFADLTTKAKPLSHVLTYKTARRITDTRKPENMDLLLGFLDKIKSDDELTAHALDGMLKAQESGAVKPAKADAAALFAHWAQSKSENVRNLAGRLGTLWGDKAAVAELIKLAEDPKSDPEKRAEAIKTLRKLDNDEARAALLRILENSLPK
jgi:hypothetical protein